MTSTDGSEYDAANASSVEHGRQFSFLNITEPSQSRLKSFKERVKQNAMKDYRQYQRIKRTQDHYRAGNRVMTKPTSSNSNAALNISDEVTSFSDPISRDSSWIDEYGLATSFFTTVHHPRQRSVEADNPSSSSQGDITPETSMKNNFMHFQRHFNAYDSQNTFLGPQSLVGAGMVDPFQTTPSDGNPNSFCLMHHFIATFAPAFLPIDQQLDQSPVNRLWAWHALGSPVLYNAILSASAARLDYLHKRKPGPLALHYKGKAIGLLNDALNSPNEFSSDATIAAVAVMIANENISGNANTIALHIRALKKLVEIRGGLSMLGWYGTLQMFISWQDLISATTTRSPPVFTCIKSAPPTIVPHPQVIENDQSYSFPTITREMPRFSHPRYKHIPDVLFQIRHLTLVVESFRCARGATASEMLAFSRSRSELEYRLQSMRTPARSRREQQDYIYEACCIAAMIYINHALHEFDQAFGVLRKLKLNVMDTLKSGEEVDHNVIGRSENIALLWVHFMGGLHSEDQAERKWFAKRIALIVRRLDLKSWEDVEDCLMRTLWIKRLRDASCEALWIEAEFSLKMMDVAHEL